MASSSPENQQDKSIVQALVAANSHDIETIASILNCKRRASSPSIHEPCLTVGTLDESIYQHTTVLPHLMVCPSIYDIPWRAAVAAIRHHATSDHSSLDMHVNDFLHHNGTVVWSSKQQQQKNSKRRTSPSKRPRPGEIETRITPAKWLLRMTEAILERTHEGSSHGNNSEDKNVQDLLWMLSNILHVAHSFDPILSREILDRIFIRKAIRPSCVHGLLRHVVRHVDKLLTPADWRGLQSALQKESARLESFSDIDLADTVTCILQTAAHASESKTVAGQKVFQRWIDIFLLTLKACGSFVDEALVVTFATLESAQFQCWCNTLLQMDHRNEGHMVVHALILLARGMAGRCEANEWRVSAFWDKVLGVASWSSTSLELRSITYIAKGCFKGPSSLDGLGRIVYESIRTSKGAVNENNARFWVRSTTDALLLEKDVLRLLPAATVIATILQECDSLRSEVFDKLMEYGAKSNRVANVLTMAVSFLANSSSILFSPEDKLMNLLNLPISLEVLDCFSAKHSRANSFGVLQRRIFEFVRDQLSIVYIVKPNIDNDGHHPTVQAKRCLILLMNLFEALECGQTQNARDLLCRVIVDNNPPIPLETRSWLYEYLYEHVIGGTVAKSSCNLYCRMSLLRVLSILCNDDEEFCVELGLRRLNDRFIQDKEDLPGLFRLLLVLFRSVEPSSFEELRCVIAQSLSKSKSRDHLVVKKSLFYKPVLVCLALIADIPVALKLDVLKAKSRLRQHKLGEDSTPLPCIFGIQAHSSDATGIGSAEACQMPKEAVKFQALLELFLVDQSTDSAPASFSTSTAEELECRLVAIARWITDQLVEPHPWLSHPRTAALISTSTNCFCWLLLSSFNRIWKDKRKTNEVEVIIAATTLFFEVSTCPTVQSHFAMKSNESLRQVPLLWELYNLIAEEKKARLLLATMEKKRIVARSSHWEKNETTDGSIRRLRSGVLRLLWSRMKSALNDSSASITDTAEQNDPLECIQTIIKRLCKNLVAVQEGQSGGLSHDLYENFLACIDIGLEILDVKAQNGYQIFTDDVATFCASQLKIVLKQFPLQRPGSLKKILIAWLWGTPKLGRSLYLAKSRVASDDEDVALAGQGNSAIVQCFAELHDVATMKHKSSIQSLRSKDSIVDERSSATSRKVPFFNFSNEKMWEGAYSALAQITRNHWNESKKRIVEMKSNVFRFSEDLEAFFSARSNQLQVCLDGIVKSVCSSESELVVLHLPYSVKTDISHSCDAFLSCLLQALALLSEANPKLLDTECFEAAASCVHAWVQCSGEDLPFAVLQWKKAENDVVASYPSQNTDALHRRLEKMAMKVLDLEKTLRRLVSSDDAPFIDRMSELASHKDGGKEHRASLSEMMLQKHKLLEKVISLPVTKKIRKKRKRQQKSASGETSQHSSIVGKWLDIERNDGHKITKNEDFDDLNDFLMEG